MKVFYFEKLFIFKVDYLKSGILDSFIIHYYIGIFMENKGLETEYIKFWVDGEILFGEYKKDLNIDLNSAKKIAGSRVAFCNGKSFPHILIISGISSTSREAREYFSKDDGIKYMKSLALIVGSPLNRTIGNFFLILNNPKVPTKIFTDLKEALEWSKSYI